MRNKELEEKSQLLKELEIFRSGTPNSSKINELREQVNILIPVVMLQAKIIDSLQEIKEKVNGTKGKGK